MLNILLGLILNYLYVQICIVLFILPFYLLYLRRHAPKSDSKISLNQHLEYFFLSKQANYLVFFWAMGEALIWFVIPEFLLLLLVFMRIRRKKELLLYDVGGTVVGTILAYIIGASNQTIASLPFIKIKMVEQTISWYQHLGVWGLLYQPFSGVPYKVFTLTANRFDFFLPFYIAVAIIVRMSRYTITFGLFVLIYPGLHSFVRRNYIYLVIVATIIFSLLLYKVAHSFGPAYKVTLTTFISSIC